MFFFFKPGLFWLIWLITFFSAGKERVVNAFCTEGGEWPTPPQNTHTGISLPVFFLIRPHPSAA